MRVSINAAERSLATLAVDLGDKKCDAARKALAELHIEELAVAALQGRIRDVRIAIKDLKEYVFDWGFDERRALAICLRIYRDQLVKLSEKEEKLIVETDGTREKIGDISDFLARLAGQEDLWRERAEETGGIEQITLTTAKGSVTTTPDLLREAIDTVKDRRGRQPEPV